VKTQSSASPPEDRDMQGYEQDFHAWTQRTAALLRAGRFEEADIEHVAEGFPPASPYRVDQILDEDFLR
jgi:hypothetical protein